MELTEVGQCLSSETRTKLLRLVAERPDSAIGAYKRYERAYSEGKHRETIYRELENLVEAELVAKEYDSDEGRIEYRPRYERLLVDLGDGTVSPCEGDRS